MAVYWQSMDVDYLVRAYLLLSEDLNIAKANSSLSCSLYSFLFHLRFLSCSEPVPKTGRIERCGQLQQLYIRCPDQISQQTWCSLNSMGLLCKCAHISVTLSRSSGFLPRRWDVTIFIPMGSSQDVSSTLSFCWDVCTQLSSGKIRN